MSHITLALSQDWRGNSQSNLIAHTIKVACQAIENFALRVRMTRWRLISTAPCNQILELRIVDNKKVSTLEFPCLQIDAGLWINVDLGATIKVHPIQWRAWQGAKSPQPYHTRIKLAGSRVHVRTRIPPWGRRQAAAA